MKRTALSLAILATVATSALAQAAKNDYEVDNKRPPRDLAAEVEQRLDTAMNDRAKCLAAAGLREKDDFIVRSATRVSVRDGAWTPANRAQLAKCLAGAN